ncbi:hypothetical protein ACR3IL_09630 [Streptococcus iniae]|nr:hypothetical protein BKX95_10140 [Streptococcus iniae]
MRILEELKHRRATLINEISELDHQIQQFEVTLKEIKRETIKKQVKHTLGLLLKLVIWLSFFLARAGFFYYLCRQVTNLQWLAIMFAVWLSCGSDFLYTEAKSWFFEIWKRRIKNGQGN